MKKLKIIIFLLMIILLTVPVFCHFFYVKEEKNVNAQTKEFKAEETKKVSTVSNVTFDKTVGACGFIDDPIEDVLSGLGTVREYHNYRWVTEKFKECRFTQGTWWNWDSYYKKLNDLGVDPVPCIQGTSQADRSGYNGNKQQKPINPGEDSLNAASYSEHAQTMFQFAARYGSVKVDDSKLLLENGQTRVSGLGYIKYYENWNEPDKTWEGDESHFSGAEYAAMSSADYDGHEGTLGDTYGIKNADPDAKLVMGGIAGGRWTVEYLEEMKTWAEEHRTDKKLPIDVINFHMYSAKKSPEEYEYIENFEKIVAWRDENAPDLEIWLTEFGWDTNTASEHGASYENQRNFLMRTYLIANAHGIDRSTMYMSRDTSAQSVTGKYATSGLTTLKGEQKKKTSWYGVATLKNALTGFVMDEIIAETENLYNYKLVNEETGETCYVLWSPTQDGSKIDNYMLEVGNVESAKVTTFVDKSAVGNTTELSLDNGKVAVNVNETPIFVKVKGEQAEEEKEPLTYSMELNAYSEKEVVNPGDTITVKAKIKDIELNDFKGILAIVGKFEYSQDVFEIESISGLNYWNLNMDYFNSENNKLVTERIDYQTKAGEVFQVVLKVKEDAKLGEVVIKFSSIEAGTGEDDNGLVETEDCELKLEIKEEETPTILKGDLDLNGVINANDLAQMKLHCIKLRILTGDSFEAAKLDNNDTVDVNDLAILKRMMIGLK